MKVLLRADASATQGTGHVMRCLTLAEALRVTGHHVVLVTNNSGVSWLDELVIAQGLDVVHVAQHSLDSELVGSVAPDWLVVDSYEIRHTAISACRNKAKVLAIVDGDDRSIDADLFLITTSEQKTCPGPRMFEADFSRAHGTPSFARRLSRFVASARGNSRQTPRMLLRSWEEAIQRAPSFP